MLDVNLHFLTIGHRGCAGIEPENTLRAIERAIAIGCTMVEVDVHLVEDELMVIHDPTVDRTTNGNGLLSDYSVAALRELDAGMGESVPFLEEVLELCFGKVALNIEIKGEGCVEALVKLIEKRTVPDLVVSSFDWDQLVEFRRLSEHGKLAILVKDMCRVEEAFLLAKELSALAINPYIEILDRAMVVRAHAMGLKVYAYTVQTVEDLAHVRNAGADGCFADDPDMVLQSL